MTTADRKARREAKRAARQAREEERLAAEREREEDRLAAIEKEKEEERERQQEERRAVRLREPTKAELRHEVWLHRATVGDGIRLAFGFLLFSTILFVVFWGLLGSGILSALAGLSSNN